MTMKRSAKSFVSYPLPAAPGGTRGGRCDRKERLIAAVHSLIIAPVTSGGKPPVFDVWASLSDEEAAVLRTRLTDERRPAGEVFIHDGAIDECVYLIREGEVEVRRRDQVLARL